MAVLATVGVEPILNNSKNKFFIVFLVHDVSYSLYCKIRLCTDVL
jgi:hypothetical protein